MQMKVKREISATNSDCNTRMKETYHFEIAAKHEIAAQWKTQLTLVVLGLDTVHVQKMLEVLS